MARFFGRLRGSRGEVTRLGTPSSGLTAEANGWEIGGEVRCYVDTDGHDAVSFYLTGGSNGVVRGRHVATYYWDGERLVNSENDEEEGR